MSGSGGVSIARGIRGENRFYNPPPMRRLQQEKQLQQEREKQLQQEKHLQPDKLKPDKQQARLPKVLTSSSSKNNKKRVESDECGSSDCSVSSRTSADSSNLDRFLEFTTPVVSAQYLPKVMPISGIWVFPPFWVFLLILGFLDAEKILGDG